MHDANRYAVYDSVNRNIYILILLKVLCIFFLKNLMDSFNILCVEVGSCKFSWWQLRAIMDDFMDTNFLPKLSAAECILYLNFNQIMVT